VDKPDLKGRQAIFKVHLKGITLQDEADDIAGRLAGLTPGFAGADIANICNEAAIIAARRKAETVTIDDFEKATDRIIGGLESNKIMSKEERSIVAHHEAGHAVAGWFLEFADPLLKVTIIPRSSGALGFAQYLPKEVFLRTKDQIMDIVCMTLAGRAAEDIFFGRATTGASDDLRRVTDLVYSTIQLYGMNERLGQLSFPKDPNAMWEDRPYSEKTARAMDEEAKTILDDAYDRTLGLLTTHKEAVRKVAEALLEKETITHDDIVSLIGPRPFAGDPAYNEFIRRRKEIKESKGEPVATDANTEAMPDGTIPGLAFQRS
jgi:AFG3 family protein